MGYAVHDSKVGSVTSTVACYSDAGDAVYGTVIASVISTVSC
jgi:hypothetical protein